MNVFCIRQLMDVFKCTFDEILRFVYHTVKKSLEHVIYKKKYIFHQRLGFFLKKTVTNPFNCYVDKIHYDIPIKVKVLCRLVKYKQIITKKKKATKTITNLIK